VKYAFKDLVAQGVGELINKKVIKPSRQEVKHNNAARSAKMRIFSKL
jgi:16S rRNA C1402 N4-methylase RsmH